MANIKTGKELIESHKPKNFKYRYIITDESLYKELENDQFDLNELDTIHNDNLVQQALSCEYKFYERDIVGKMKDPTYLDEGIVISKKMVTKSDKKLNKVGVGFFMYNDRKHVVIRMYYDRFDIIEIFILT
jgi:hypothetical protein